MGLPAGYVTDQLVSADPEDNKSSVRVATTAALAAYTRTANVITADAPGALADQDGVTLVAGDSLLLLTGAAAADNGIYVVTEVGDGFAPFVLTRRQDANADAKVTSGMATRVEEGIQYGPVGTKPGRRFVLITPNPITLNTTGLDFRPVADISDGDWQQSVLDKDLTAPPGGESVGDRYIVAAGATGAWAGHDDEIAEWGGANWSFTVPTEGTFAWVEDEDTLYVFDGKAWTLFSGGAGGVPIDVSAVSVSGVQNAWQPGGLPSAIEGTSYEVSSVTAGSTINGLDVDTADPTQVYLKFFRNADASGDALRWNNESGSAAAQDRIQCPGSTAYFQRRGETVALAYHTGISRWLLLPGISFSEQLLALCQDNPNAIPLVNSGGAAGFLTLGTNELLVNIGAGIATAILNPSTVFGRKRTGNAGIQAHVIHDNADDTVVQTTDATPTTVATIGTISNNRVLRVMVDVVGYNPSTGDSAHYLVAVTGRRDGGGAVTIKDEDFISMFEDVPAWDLTFTPSGTNILAQVTGTAATTIEWRCQWYIDEHG